MNNLDSYFLSVDDCIFCPPVLTNIRNYLNCEQVFIYKLDRQKELENIIYPSDRQTSFGEKISDSSVYQIDQNIIDIMLHKSNKNYNNEDEDTAPLKKSEWSFPIYLQTPEIIEINNQNSLWGLLLIYDYNYLRKWTKIEEKYVDKMVKEMTLAIERAIIYKQFKQIEKSIKYYQFFDQKTGLINYSSFLDCLDYEWRNLAREKQAISLILLEVIQHEHPGGKIRDDIAKLVQEEIKRPADIVAGYNDNKIMIMLPLTDNEGALWVNQKIDKQIKRFCKDRLYQCRSSIITCIPDIEKDYQGLLNELEKPFSQDFDPQKNIYNQNLK